MDEGAGDREALALAAGEVGRAFLDDGLIAHRHALDEFLGAGEAGGAHGVDQGEAGAPGEDARLYAAVQAVGAELCPALGIAIPVGKDSMSMRTVWDGKAVTAPVSLIVSAFAPVTDVRRTLIAARLARAARLGDDG